VTLKTNASLYGGFNGSESDFNQRNWTTNFSIVDGRGIDSVVIIAAGATNTTRLDGLVIRNGSAALGVGMRCLNTAPRIASNRMIHKLAGRGGGIACSNSPAEIAFNWIRENVATNSSSAAGGIYCFRSAATIRNNRILGNRWLGSALFGAGG